MGASLRALVVDDEPLARARLRSLLAAAADVEVVGECADGLSAREAIARLRPDIVFLDVQMPQGDGFAALEGLDPAHLPAVVFVTAHDRFALKAFEVHAVDYLLKPYDVERFEAALERSRQRLRGGAPRLDPRVLETLAELQSPRRSERLVVRGEGRSILVRPEDVDWIEAAGNHSVLHVGPESHALRETMASLGARLDERRFVRIHRSTIVNVDRIRQLVPASHGEWRVQLDGGVTLPVGRKHRDRLAELLGLA